MLCCLSSQSQRIFERTAHPPVLLKTTHSKQWIFNFKMGLNKDWILHFMPVIAVAFLHGSGCCRMWPGRKVHGVQAPSECACSIPNSHICGRCWGMRYCEKYQLGVGMLASSWYSRKASVLKLKTLIPDRCQSDRVCPWCTSQSLPKRDAPAVGASWDTQGCSCKVCAVKFPGCSELILF